MNRRDFITGSLAIIGGGAISSPVKSMMGTVGTKDVPNADSWENPYVTDGLVAFWDAEWNVGPGRHNNSTAVWKDLVGENNGSLTGSLTWSDNSLDYSGGYVSLPNNLGVSLGCVECCFHAPAALASL